MMVGELLMDTKPANRTTLKFYPNCHVAMGKIKELESEFKRVFKRGPKSELVYGISGNNDDVNHYIGVSYLDSDNEEVKWFKGQKL